MYCHYVAEQDEQGDTAINTAEQALTLWEAGGDKNRREAYRLYDSVIDRLPLTERGSFGQLNFYVTLHRGKDGGV